MPIIPGDNNLRDKIYCHAQELAGVDAQVIVNPQEPVEDTKLQVKQGKGYFVIMLVLCMFCCCDCCIL